MRENIRMRRLLLFLALTLPLAAQNEAALRQYFEGKYVRVKFDLPGTKDGIDVHYKQEPPLDFKSYSQRTRNYPIALQKGDRAMVTTIRVKPKNIEFQLGGGGFGTAGDKKPSSYLPAVTKSSTELRLENDLKNETDPKRRDRIRSDLARLSADRMRAERERQARMKELEILNRGELERKQREGGSRINLWFPENYLKEATPTPRDLMRMLAEWVDFGLIGEVVPPRRDPPQPTSQSSGLRRGLTREQVHQILGPPQRFKESKQGDLDTLTDQWDRNDSVTEVVYVGGVVVKFSTSSK